MRSRLFVIFQTGSSTTKLPAARSSEKLSEGFGQRNAVYQPARCLHRTGRSESSEMQRYA